MRIGRPLLSAVVALVVMWVGCGGDDPAPGSPDGGLREDATADAPAMEAAPDAASEAAADACASGGCGNEIVEVAAGTHHQCALRRDGKVVCWGRSDEWALGVDAKPSDPVCAAGIKCLLPLFVPGVSDAVHIAVGRANTCAIKKDGSLVCWGDNPEGILGVDPATLPHSPAPIAIPFGGAKIAQVVVGFNNACARTETGDVYCWGKNSTCLTGDTTNGSRILVPKKIVLGASDATDIGISSGEPAIAHACAVRGSDTVWCWGSNYNFELAQPNTSGRACTDNGWEIPKQVPGQSGIVDVAVTSSASCALSASGVVQCWGHRDYGMTASNGTTSPIPNTVTGLPVNAIKRIEMGLFWASAQDQGGNTWSWGTALYGEMGDGTRTGASCPNFMSCRFVVTPVANLGNVRQLSPGYEHGVALKRDGTVVGWGLNDLDMAGHAHGTNGDVTCHGGAACNPTPVVVKLPD